MWALDITLHVSLCFRYKFSALEGLASSIRSFLCPSILSRTFPDAQVPCGIEISGQLCGASVCLDKMAPHYEATHKANVDEGPYCAKILDDGSASVHMIKKYSFPENGEGWFSSYSGIDPVVSRTAVGGCFAFDLQKTSPSELRFGVRQLGRGPSRHRLASVTVRFGPAEGTCVQFALSRALAADERLGDAALCAGTPPAVGRVEPAFLAPTLVLQTGTPPPEKPWQLAITVTLVFKAVKDAPS